jgi:hypothetical protein
MEINLSCPHCGNPSVELHPPDSVHPQAHWRCPACGEKCRNPGAKIGPAARANFAVGLAAILGFFTVLICYLLMP